jgi:hypothetical protein
MCALVLLCVQFAPLPVGWLYMNEVSNSKGVAVGSFMHWFCILLSALFAGPLLSNEEIGPYVFCIYGGLTAATTIFIFFAVKETKGLTES